MDGIIDGKCKRKSPQQRAKHQQLWRPTDDCHQLVLHVGSHLPDDILVPHLKSIFDLSYARVMLIQFAFFGAYFIFSLPSAKIIDWIGYQRSMVLGLLMMGLVRSCSYRRRVSRYPLFLER